MTAMETPWRNAIVAHGEAPPGDLLPNPRNPKVHPKAQQQALGAAIGELGWLAPVIVNQRTQHVRSPTHHTRGLGR